MHDGKSHLGGLRGKAAWSDGHPGQAPAQLLLQGHVGLLQFSWEPLGVSSGSGPPWL